MGGGAGTEPGLEASLGRGCGATLWGSWTLTFTEDTPSTSPATVSQFLHQGARVIRRHEEGEADGPVLIDLEVPHLTPGDHIPLSGGRLDGGEGRQNGVFLIVPLSCHSRLSETAHRS